MKSQEIDINKQEVYKKEKKDKNNEKMHYDNPVYQNIEDFLNNDSQKEILSFFVNYVQEHTFISKRCLCNDFLDNKFDPEFRYNVYSLFRRTVNRKFQPIFRQGIELKILINYSKSTLKIIDISEAKLERLKQFFII